MNRIKTFNLKTAALVAAFMMTLLCTVPVLAQADTTTATTTDTTVTNDPAKSPLLQGTNLNATPADQSPYNGMGEPIPVRKDAWTWYWNEKAHIDIDPEDKAHFWGDDIVSNFFRNISNQVFIPFWNGAMEYDFIRAGLLLIIAGMLLGLGATIVMPKKPDAK